MHAFAFANPCFRGLNRVANSIRRVNSLVSYFALTAGSQMLECAAAGGVRPALGRNRRSLRKKPTRRKDPRCGIANGHNVDCEYGHQVVVEDGASIETVELPSAGRVELSQQFDVTSAGHLSFDYVMLLRPGVGSSAGSALVNVKLTHCDSQKSFSILEQSVEGRERGGRRVASSAREHVLVSLPRAGVYELRFTTAVDPSSPGAESHLLVDDVQIMNSSGEVLARMASLSSVGRVRQET